MRNDGAAWLHFRDLGFATAVNDSNRTYLEMMGYGNT